MQNFFSLHRCTPGGAPLTLGRKLNELFLVLLVLISLTLVIWLSDADRRLSALVFFPQQEWPGLEDPFWQWVYTWGPLPAWICGLAALVVMVAGIWWQRLRGLRRQGLFLLLLLVIGPGLVTNVLLKDNLGRPRPREVVEFGGEHRFHQFWQPGDAGANSSFPSGHASIAFAMIGPWFLVRGRNRIPADRFLVVGLGWGVLVGAARILQGGHFLSDTLWAGGVVYLTAQLLAIWLKPEQDDPLP
ncbi:phosphatase PAP2 family protein [Desulfogranum mediterraneum]|uniref:phosphatase PAP2 family protein n=1 Tax=Desulfogranum mediterraneum TaxID=160661 RepID=UPI001376F1CB|nr:phosphatase PAP2 family protein [Desulfogranum mediterraneum]